MELNQWSKGKDSGALLCKQEALAIHPMHLNTVNAPIASMQLEHCSIADVAKTF